MVNLVGAYPCGRSKARRGEGTKAGRDKETNGMRNKQHIMVLVIKLFADLHPVRDVSLGRKKIVSKCRIPLGMHLSLMGGDVSRLRAFRAFRAFVPLVTRNL